MGKIAEIMTFASGSLILGLATKKIDDKKVLCCCAMEINFGIKLSNSGRSAVWKRARFGSERPPVQIWAPRIWLLAVVYWKYDL